MTSRSFPLAPAGTTTWTYDSTLNGNKGVGKLTGVTDPSGSAAYTYNALGQRTRVVRITGGKTYQIDYVYDLAGNVTQITMPSGRVVTYTRNTRAQVTAVATKDNAAAASNTVVSSAVWRPFGPLASMTFGNSLALTLSYDNDGRVTGIGATGAGTTVQNLSYGYDFASNITSIGDSVNANRSQTFVYDDLNRLTSATGLYGTNTYAYDAVGNRTQRTVTLPVAGTETYTVAANSNRLTSISGAVNRSFTYEASGQAATDQRSPVSAWSYTTDRAGRMSATVLNSVTQTNYAYDGDELRIANTNNLTAAITHYIYDANGQLIAEMNGATGAVIREYIWLGALPIGYVDRLGTAGASRLFFMHADHLGRPQKITNSARAIVWDGVFAPFGEIYSVTGSILNVLMFPGQVYDPETGLTQNWHRDYDANLGRYLESDPIGLAGGLNTYAYTGGNPVSRVDQDGRIWNYLAGAGFGMAVGYLLDEDGCYTWQEALDDAVLGASGELALRLLGLALRSERFAAFAGRFMGGGRGGPAIRAGGGGGSSFGGGGFGRGGAPSSFDDFGQFMRSFVADESGSLGFRAEASANLRRIGLDGVELAGSTFNSGRKALENAGFELVQTTNTGRKVFINPNTGGRVTYDSGRALGFGQVPHWTIQDAGGQFYTRLGRPWFGPSSPRGGKHIPGG